MIKQFLLRVAILALVGVTLLVLSACRDDGSSSTAPMEVIGVVEFDHLVRSGTTATINGGSYLLLVTSAREQDDVALRVFERNADGLPAEVGSLVAPSGGHHPHFATTSGIAVAGGAAYIPLGGSDRPGLWIVDVSDPVSPRELAMTELEGVPQSVAVDGELAVVSGLFGGISLLDVSDPAAPQLQSHYPYSAVTETHVALAADLLFVSDGRTVAVIDVSSSDAPVEIGAYENPSWSRPDATAQDSGSSLAVRAPTNVVVLDDLLYLPEAGSGLEIVSIADPTQPELVEQLDIEQGAINLAVSGSNVFVLGGIELPEPGESIPPFTVLRVDAMDPSNPEIVDELTDLSGFPSHLQSLVADEDHLYFLNISSHQVAIISAPRESDE